MSYSEGSSSEFYQELVVRPFFRNHVEKQTLEQLDNLGIGFLHNMETSIDNLTEMVERAEIHAEFTPCSDEFCSLPVARQDVLRCHESNRPFCETCFVEHRKTCPECQEAQVRMQQAIRNFVAK